MDSRPTAIVYLDAFNFYKSQLVQRPQNKWVNLEALFDRVLPSYRVVKIHYFAARVRGSANPEDPKAPDRQAVLIRALETLERVETHLSHFSINAGRAREHVVDRSEPPSTWLNVWKVQEKGSDVKLAVQLLLDALDKLADIHVVVSGDSDLAEPIKVVIERFKQRVGVLYPRNNQVGDFESAGLTFSRFLHPADVAASQFPRTVVDGRQRQIVRPQEWK